ncbi:hypothetical protein O7599_08280 [Streptomyces sp. WMMC500]|uniref:hypothetical protein n=1 Tax=Streptomyces sp. WMMC500 TaxID=3015154 RepID=UPI00248C1587|nr:hypothetical protein [Streptomyces sp. WMMC500]WBB62516.1 hypothetical protein O7599_08280 [Streptomyces sp. WMMC500]
MTDSSKTTMLAGVAGGYLLGRTKKARLALTLAAIVAGRRLAPRDLLEKGAAKITDKTPAAGQPDQVKDQLMTAARTAVSSLFDRRVEFFTDSLRERTDRLSELREQRDARDAGDADEEEGEEDEEDDEGDEGGRHTATAKRRPAGRKKTGGAASGPRKKVPSGGGGSRATARATGKGTGTKSADRPRGRERS